MRVIVGLGNPGPEYEETRHNIGFKVVDFLSKNHRIPVNQKKYNSITGKGIIRGEEVLLVKPQTFMNLSGKALKKILDSLALATGDFLVVHDDIDVPFGKIKKKSKGGDAGQKGVGSIIEYLKTDLFCRIRVGVGRPPERMNPSDYVLSPFDPDELEVAESAIQLAGEEILAWVRAS